MFPHVTLMKSEKYKILGKKKIRMYCIVPHGTHIAARSEYLGQSYLELTEFLRDLLDILALRFEVNKTVPCSISSLSQLRTVLLKNDGMLRRERPKLVN